jgi:hypothetical protein
LRHAGLGVRNNGPGEATEFHAGSDHQAVKRQSGSIGQGEDAIDRIDAVDMADQNPDAIAANEFVKVIATVGGLSVGVRQACMAIRLNQSDIETAGPPQVKKSGKSGSAGSTPANNYYTVMGIFLFRLLGSPWAAGKPNEFAVRDHDAPLWRKFVIQWFLPESPAGLRISQSVLPVR